MKRIPLTRLPLNPWSIFGIAAAGLVLLTLSATADDRPPDRHPEERDGAATVIHRADVIRNRGTNGDNCASGRSYPRPERA